MTSLFTLSTTPLRRAGTIASLLIATAISTGTASAAGIIMPLFGNTSAQFNAAAAAAQKVAVSAILNPDNGPGSRKVSGISNQVTRLRSMGCLSFGYISTLYGSEAQSEVYRQIDAYKSWYGCYGVFFDEMSDKTSKLSYYRSIYNYAKKKGMSVIGNPGTFVPSSYIGVADVLVTYEDAITRGWGSHRPASWTAAYPARRFGAIVYATPSSSMQGVIDRAISLNYGWVFVTDGSGANPFRNAPSYLSAEADYVKTKNNGARF